MSDRDEYTPVLPESLPSFSVPGFERPTLGQRAAETVARVVGSWAFIGAQTLGIFGWVVLNMAGVISWDPYPFILLNLFMSLQAAYTAPMIMMSQNRESGKDRYLSRSSYFVTAKTDFDVQELRVLISLQNERIEQLLDQLQEKKE